MSLRGCGDTIPRGLGSWCACFGLSVGVLLAVSSHQSPCVLLGKSLMMCQGSCCSLRAWLSSVGSRSHHPGLQPAAAARSSARGERGTDSTKEWLCCLVYWMFWCFSTTAPVTVTPEWLRSSSECRDERQISKWPGTPCSQWKSSDVNPLLGFLEEKQRQRRHTWCISDVLMEKKNYFQLQGGRNLCRVFWGTSCPLSALCFSFPANIPQSRFSPRQHWIVPVCNLSFCRRMFLPILYQILQSLKAEVASDAHRFCWILFFPPRHACFQKWVGILPEMSTVTPTFGELFFFLLLYIFSLISGSREPTGIYQSVSHPVSLQQLPAFA